MVWDCQRIHSGKIVDISTYGSEAQKTFLLIVCKYIWKKSLSKVCKYIWKKSLSKEYFEKKVGEEN